MKDTNQIILTLSIILWGLIIILGGLFVWIITDGFNEREDKQIQVGNVVIDEENFETIVNHFGEGQILICDFDGGCGVINKVKIDEGS